MGVCVCACLCACLRGCQECLPTWVQACAHSYVFDCKIKIFSSIGGRGASVMQQQLTKEQLLHVRRRISIKISSITYKLVLLCYSMPLFQYIS